MLRLLSIAVILMAVPRAGWADCAPHCLGLLCGERSTVVSGTLQPDAGASRGTVLVVEAVLRLAAGARAPNPGDRLSGWSGTTATSGPVVGYYQAADLSVPMGIFPVGADGNVHCRGWGEATSAPEGMGVTPARLATLSGLADFRACQAELQKSGYSFQACDDNGCAVGGKGLSLPPMLLVVAAAIAANRRRRHPHPCPPELES